MKIYQTMLKVVLIFICYLTLTSCDILLMALMMSMPSENYTHTNTQTYPYYATSAPTFYIPPDFSFDSNPTTNFNINTMPTTNFDSTPTESNSTTSSSNDPSFSRTTTESLERYGYIDCVHCRGTGDCQTCNGDGLMPGSFGLGDIECSSCYSQNKGKCRWCGGTGTRWGLKK